MKKLKKEDVVFQLQNTSYRLVGKWNGTQKYNTFKSIDCGHKFSILWRNLLRKIENKETKCKDCSCQDRIKGITNNFEEIKNYIYKETQREYKVLSKEKDYINNKSLIQVLHKTCGKPFPINFSNFQQGKRCPHCARKSQESKTAQLLKRVLSHLNVFFEEEKIFLDCSNPFTQNKLRFDIYIQELNLAIEIDGEQHSVPISRFGGKTELIKNQYRDYLKNKFCFENNINLIRVNLYDTELKRKKSYEEMKLEIFYLVNVIIDKKLLITNK